MVEYDEIRKIIESKQKEEEERRKTHAKLMASQPYQDQVKFIQSFTHDALYLLKACLTYSSRDQDFADNSLVLRSTDDLGQSIVAALALVQEGLINPVRRELRYVIESSIKYLYIDQQPNLTTIDDRLEFLEKNVSSSKNNSSIDMRQELKLEAMHPSDASQFMDEIYDAYRNCCAYVHVSRRQIEERLQYNIEGRSLGMETADELRNIGRLMFRVYDMALALYLHGYGLAMTGDVYIQVLDDIEKWKFHKGKYMSVISSYFDYKNERNIRKYGESRPWSPVGWPPKRL